VPEALGAVYRARDTKLNRNVGLKVLLLEVAGDPERLARFRREAQVLASLNHPNIGAIHGLEETDGRVGSGPQRDSGAGPEPNAQSLRPVCAGNARLVYNGGTELRISSSSALVP
jgi:serine/threonine protein kinase